jgi:hypothetical protein
MMKDEILERRVRVLEIFERATLLENSKEEFLSPSGLYLLTTEEFSTGEKTWSYTRGCINRVSDQAIIATIHRNYSQFWHTWVQHPNGKEYLLCGEDYQGYNVIDLANAENHFFLPDEAINGTGFCWAAVYPSPDGLTLAVDGCYWANTGELVFFDFSDPTDLPLRELERIEDLRKPLGWTDSAKFNDEPRRKRTGYQPLISWFGTIHLE